MARLGADVDELQQLADLLSSSARTLHDGAGDITSVLRVTWWRGGLADAFRQAWYGRHALELHVIASRMDDLGDRLRVQIAQQRDASSADGMLRPVGPLVPGPSERAILAEERISGWLDPGGWGVTRSDLDNIRDELAGLSPEDRSMVIQQLSDEELQILWDQIRESPNRPFNGGGYSHAEMADFFRSVAPGLSPEALDRLLGPDALGDVNSVGAVTADTSSARDVIADAIDPGGSGPGKSEIEIRRLDSGAWIVVVPGVTDLSDNAAPWNWYNLEGENPQDTPRDMYYANRAATGDGDGSATYENAYAFMVRSAMAKAEIPPGADVMLVGHSFGAYTALELANDPSFNGSGGYNVTNVVAAGADTDWLADDVPASTDVLVLNNEQDLAYRAERALGRDGNPDHEVVFDGGTDRGGQGHSEIYYSDALRSGLADGYLDGLPPQYLSGGERLQIEIHDPYRQPE